MADIDGRAFASTGFSPPNTNTTSSAFLTLGTSGDSDETPVGIHRAYAAPARVAKQRRPEHFDMMFDNEQAKETEIVTSSSSTSNRSQKERYLQRMQLQKDLEEVELQQRNIDLERAMLRLDVDDIQSQTSVEVSVSGERLPKHVGGLPSGAMPSQEGLSHGHKGD